VSTHSREDVKVKTLMLGIVGLAGLSALLGGLIGYNSQPEPEVRTVTVTEVEKVTPKACIEALDAANLFVERTGHLIGLSAAALEAAGDLKLERTLALTKRVEGAEDRLVPAIKKYGKAAGKCRQAG